MITFATRIPAPPASLAGRLFGLLVAALLASCWPAGAQQPSVDAMRAELMPLTGRARLTALHELVNRIEGRQPQDALVLATEGLDLARREGDPVLEATFLASASYCSTLTGDFEQALRLGRESLEVGRRIGNKERIATAHNVLGIAFTFMGSYSRALEEHLESLRLREEYSLEAAAIKSLMNIGVLYHQMGQYEKAISNYQKIIEKLHNDATVSTVVQARLNIGFAEIKQGRFEQALRNHEAALALIEKHNHPALLAYAYLNLGLACTGLKRYGEARTHLLRSLAEYDKQDQKHARVQVLNALGRLHMLTRAPDQAIAYAQEAASLAQRINARNELMSSYELLSEMHLRQNNTREALKYYKLYSETKDSIYTLQESGKIADINTQLILTKKDKDIELLQKAKKINELELKNNKRNTIIFVSGIGLLAGVILGLVTYNKKINQHKKKLEETNLALESLNRQLQEKIHEIKTLTGLLPICASCKKIRNDEGYWEQLEGYISEHTSATFTHGICPTCADELYPGALRKLAADRQDEA